MKFIIVTIVIVVSGIQAYEFGIKQGHAEILTQQHGVYTNHAESFNQGFEACQEQF